jgi:LPLT family lysophospholipid transporter-like MFS transporter
VIPLGIAMGLLVILLNFIDNVWLAVPFLILLGGLGGFLVVPMNALLQHRGHNLMGAGRSIAVQNFNEQACILGWGRSTACPPAGAVGLWRHHRRLAWWWPASCG